MESIITLKVHSEKRLAPYEMKNEVRKALTKNGISVSDDFVMTEIRGMKLTNGSFDKADVENAYKAHIMALQNSRIK